MASTPTLVPSAKFGTCTEKLMVPGATSNRSRHEVHFHFGTGRSNELSETFIPLEMLFLSTLRLHVWLVASGKLKLVLP